MQFSPADTQAVEDATLAMFRAMEGRALASHGNEHDATATLVGAEGLLNQSEPGNGPDWIRFFDEAELHAEFAPCYRDLGNADRAGTHAAKSINVSQDDFVRSALLSISPGTLASPRPRL